MKRRFDLYLKDILDSINRVEEYTSNLGLKEFEKNKIVVDAVLRNLEIIGEATIQLPQTIKGKYDNVPWKDIQDFRIVVAHHYWKVNIERIWDIVKNKLGTLKEQIETILLREDENTKEK